MSDLVVRCRRPRYRASRNYPHLVAERLNHDLGLDFVDVTFSGATTAHVLVDQQRGAPPQIAALDGSETLVTGCARWRNWC